MTETFYGPWSVAVVGKDSNFDQRFVITGSDTADGGYAGVVGFSIGVTGDEWTLTMDWLDSNQFRPSRIERAARYDVRDALIVTLGADDGPEATADRDFNDMVLVLRSEDPALDALRPSGNPYDFTITEGMLVPPEKDPKHPERQKHP
jgi:hypothetical protein